MMVTWDQRCGVSSTSAAAKGRAADQLSLGWGLHARGLGNWPNKTCTNSRLCWRVSILHLPCCAPHPSTCTNFPVHIVQQTIRGDESGGPMMWLGADSLRLPQALRASQLPKRFAKSQRQPWIAGCSSHGLCWLCCSWRPWLCPCALPNGAALHGWTSWNLSSTHAPCPSVDPRLTSAPLIDRVPTVYSENLYEFMMNFVIIYWLWFHLHMFFKQLFWSILWKLLCWS